jgi:diguanylate cyclase (GGDEF)-like protein
VHDLEVRSAAPDEGGEARDWLLSLYLLPDKRGEILGVNIVAEDVTERLRAEDEIRRLANHDGLTGLPNRRLFLDRLQQALAVAQRQEGHRVAVMLLDLDHFKDVNDSLGHPVGDQLLCAVAGRLQTVLRASDTLARLGGDEFAVIQSGLQRSYGAAVLAQKLIDALAVPFRIDGNEIHTGTSVGISVYRDDGDEPEALVQRADMALYEAKEGGRARFRFFVPAMNEAATARKQLEADLRLALRNGELELVYQPQIDLANGALVAAEALLRWNHPERGVVQPASFIAVAEASGLIRPLGRWVLHEACAQARRWQESGNATVVSVNLSSAQLRHEELLTAVDEALDRSGLQPGSLALELDESLFTEPSDDVIERCLRGLAERGVQLTVDDFGTGSSSLAYLRRFPIDRIKIDRSFILDIGRNADAEAVIRAIIALGHSLGKRVVAEGVETDRQLAFLKGERCDEAQGFLLARPQSAGQVGELLAA